MAGPVDFNVEQAPTTVVVVTGPDGRRYEVRIAVLVQTAIDTGLTNPIDGLPVFNLVSQIVSQTKRREDG